MSAIAFVFPGQGSQSVGMGAALVARSPAAAAVFAAADAALGESLSRLAWEGPAETLNLTENAQPALLATSIAYLAALRELSLLWLADRVDVEVFLNSRPSYGDADTIEVGYGEEEHEESDNAIAIPAGLSVHEGFILAWLFCSIG